MTLWATLSLAACGDAETAWMKPVPSLPAVQQHPHGGSARVVVTTPPELGDRGDGGDTLRALTRPRLFDAQPDGTWRPSLAISGSDHTSRDGKTASFRLRNAQWSNSSAISVADLRRTQDSRFVERIDDPDAKDVVRVHLKQKLPGWRRLWSDEPIEPPSSDVYGGPFAIRSVASGAETVLERNHKWWGGPDRPYLDEVRLQYVPDTITARQLLQRGDVDVVTPRADSQRTPQYKALKDVSIETESHGGTWTALQFNTVNVPVQTRTVAASAFPRKLFVDSLLSGEATLDGDEAPTSADRLDGVGLTISTPVENPMTVLLDRSLTSALATKNASISHRAEDFATINQLVQNKTYDVAFVTMHDGPEVCWQCRYGDVDKDLAIRADSGDAGAASVLENKVRKDADMLPLWREVPLVAFRTAAVKGVSANGYVSTDAWNAEGWWKP